MNFGILNEVQFLAFWLCFSRWVAVLFQLPLFDNAVVPQILKILISVILTFAFFPFVEGTLIAEIKSVGVGQIWALTMFHTMTGLILGFLVKSIMSLFVAAGSILTQQIGFASVNYFDPTQAQQVGPFERIVRSGR
jgi:flagellar biosynthetic protein FliR